MNDSTPQARSPKLQNWHLSRAAIVYIRQSTPQQVLDHRESTAPVVCPRRSRVELGWAREQVMVIDDDLGKSGRSAETTGIPATSGRTRAQPRRLDPRSRDEPTGPVL